MKLGLLLALAVLNCATLRAQSLQDEVATLEKKRTVEVARATAIINQNYLKYYEALLQRANIVGDAQTANLVRAMIRRLNPEPEPAPDGRTAATATLATDPVAVLTANRWINEFTAQNGKHRNFPRDLLPGGEMTSSTHGQEGTWKIVNNELVLTLTAYPDAVEKYPLPVQLEKWRGLDRGGIPHFMSVKKPGDSPAAAASPAGKPAAAPATADFFGKPNS